MKTQTFKTYQDFLNRKDKFINGVSPEFAKINTNWEKQNKSNKGCWNCSRCSRCYVCSRCSDCSRCSGCYDCSDCSRCSGLKDKSSLELKKIKVPKIKYLHKKVYGAASQPEALDMDNWHTCEKTHCRAGWVVALAGKEGKELEERFDTLLAAMKIYDKSCPGYKINPCRFFDDNKEALADMQALAEGK